MDITGTEPFMTTVVDIANWDLVERDGYRLLVGRVTGHPRIADGRWAVTSVVVEMSRQQARTRNTVYRLGPMMADNADLSELPPKVQELILPAEGRRHVAADVTIGGDRGEGREIRSRREGSAEAGVA